MSKGRYVTHMVDVQRGIHYVVLLFIFVFCLGKRRGASSAVVGFSIGFSEPLSVANKNGYSTPLPNGHGELGSGDNLNPSLTTPTFFAPDSLACRGRI